MQTTDILAKLLATENLTVVRQNTVTASFDIQNRVLTLPQWKELTPEVEEMLVMRGRDVRSDQVPGMRRMAHLVGRFEAHALGQHDPGQLVGHLKRAVLMEDPAH